MSEQAAPLDTMRTDTQPVMGKRALVGFVLASVATLALLTLLCARLFSAGHAVQQAPVSALVGHSAPAFTVTLWNGSAGMPGKTVSLASLRGKPVVVNFWASWCQPCTEEAPVLEAAYKKYASQGVVFVGVAFSTKTSDGTSWLSQYGITYPAGQDPSGEADVAYGVTGVPETFLIDKQGKVSYKYGGMVDDGSLDQRLQALVAAHA